MVRLFQKRESIDSFYQDFVVWECCGEDEEERELYRHSRSIMSTHGFTRQSRTNSDGSMSSDAESSESSDEGESPTITIDSDDDDELKQAKEMALAIAQNPHLTAEQIQEMVKSRQAASKASKSMYKKARKKVKSGVKKTLTLSGSGVKIMYKNVEKTVLGGSPKKTPTSPRNLMSSLDLSGHGLKVETSKSASRDEGEIGMPNSSGVRMTGIVWKRRSGLGKYSAKAAWERRRVILRGTKIMYYRTGQDVDDQEESDDESGEEKASGGGKTWLEQATAFSSPFVGTTTKGARGHIDLVKENASVGASFGHSGAPTPFALSIKVLAQTKWKLCFDTHGELMHWLAAMTDVIVEGSVDVYNRQILQIYDPNPNPSLSESLYGHGQLSEPPLIANSGEKAASGHRLWVTGHYNVKSQDNVEAEFDEFVDSDGEDEVKASGYAQKFEVDPESGRDAWSLSEESLWQVGMILNLGIMLARASATSAELFWYLIVFINIALFRFLKKEKVGGTIRPKSAVITPKMALEMSMRSGVPVKPTVEEKKDGPEIPQPSGFKPLAGSTTMRIEKPTDLPVNKDGHVFAGWRIADPTKMAVRSHGYKATKKKVPSPGELYKCVHTDIFEARTRYPDMASRVQLPPVVFKDDGPKTWNAPDTFVISIAIPTDPPKLYSSSTNGGGYTITMYYVMCDDTRDILKRVTADGYNPDSEEYPDGDIQKSKVNAARLLDEWCRRAPTDDSWMARFKVLPNAQNLKEIGLPSWIAKYNGKPFLIKRPGQTGFLFRHPEKSCIEFDVSLHPFPYLAKQGICFMKESYFKKVLVTFGFLIEGRSDDELPECLIGLFQLCYPDPIHAIQGEDFMAGKAPKSFVDTA